MQKNRSRNSNPFNRRGFMKGCLACGMLSSGMAAFPPPVTAEDTRDWWPRVHPKIRVVFTHIPPEQATWPYQGYDYEARKSVLLAKMRAECPDFNFQPATARNADEAAAILEMDAEVDGYLVYMLGIWTNAAIAIARANRPTIFVDDLYAGSGEFLIAYSQAKREGLKVVGVSSSEFGDVVEALKHFDTLKKLQASTILDVTDQVPTWWGDPDAIGKRFGAKLEFINSDQLNEAYGKACPDEGAAWAQRWMVKADKVVEPGADEIAKSGRMYLAMTDLLRMKQAQAIAVDCLGLFYGGKMEAYPCLGFTQLNDNGLVGACEGDLESTITMLAMAYRTGVPGFISDPVIDTSKNQIIYAHCVAPTQVHGKAGAINPHEIRSHSEDRKGAALRSLMPLGETVTTIKFSLSRNALVMHQGVTVENVNEDKACRTKLAAEVKGDVYRLMENWDQWGWHRVTFYGDHRKTVEDLCALMGTEVFHEA